MKDMKNLDLVYAIINVIVSEYEAMLGEDDAYGDSCTARRKALEAEANSRFMSGADTGLTDALGMLCIREELMGLETGINVDRQAERIASYMTN